MKIKSEKKEYQILGATSKQFSVDTNDTMVIKLLRDKMYKNKIGAVAREISSNSRDANREAGKGNTPITITVKTDSNLLGTDSSSITFQDNGVGITPERMDNIFLKYGGSTKRDSDKFTGGFGIGAKTPFAYTDNFFITTVVKGDNGKNVEHLYQALITSDGNSEVSRMIDLGSSETNEPTGTKITVPLKSVEDQLKFEKEVVYSTNFWKVRPNLIGFTTYNHNTTNVFEDDNCIIFKEALSNSMNTDNSLFNNNVKLVALIDEIPYEVNVETLEKELGVKKLFSSNGSLKWLLKFNTGDITVSGSREDIEYVETNLKTIYAKFKDVLKVGESLLKKYHSSANSYLEACIQSSILQTLSQNYYSGRNIDEDVNGFSVSYIRFLGEVIRVVEDNYSDLMFPTYNGVKTTSNFNFKTFDVRNYIIDDNGRFKQHNSYQVSQASSDIWTKTFYNLDVAKIEPTRTARLKLVHGKKGCVIIKKKTYEEHNSALYRSNKIPQVVFDSQRSEDEKLLKLLGVELKPYSEIEKLKKESVRGVNKTDIVKVNVRVLKKTHYENSWDSLSIQYDKKGEVFVNALKGIKEMSDDNVGIESFCYIEKEKLSDFKIERWTGNNMTNGLKNSLNAIRTLLLANGVQTLGISSSKAGYFKNIPTIEEAFESLIKNDKSNKVINCVKSSIIQDNGLQHSEFLSQINVKDSVKQSFEKLSTLYNQTVAEAQKDLSVKTMLSILRGNTKGQFLKDLNIELDKDFDKDLQVGLKCVEKNPLLALMLEVKNSKGYGGVRIDRNTDKFKAIEKSFLSTCKIK